MELDVDTLRQQIPHYLTSSDRKVLLDGLKAIASGEKVNYFLSPYNDTFKNKMLQGDGWRGFQLFNFSTGKRLSVKGIVLSNSCDIDPENSEQIPSRVIFAPLVKLEKYKFLLQKNGITQANIKDVIDSVKAQKTYNALYLPANGPLEEEYIIRFDDIHSMPVAAHHDIHDKEKIFTLSAIGFYMLVFKLSVHFCRLQEGVPRKS